MRSQRKCTFRRSGVTAVEFAMTLTIIFMMFFAAIEFGRIGMVQATVDDAAYAGCRHVIVPGATTDEAEAAAMEMLNTIGLKNATVNVSAIAETTETITVDVSVPMDNNSWIAPFYTKGLQITGSASLHTERGPAVQGNALDAIMTATVDPSTTTSGGKSAVVDPGTGEEPEVVVPTPEDPDPAPPLPTPPPPPPLVF